MGLVLHGTQEEFQSLEHPENVCWEVCEEQQPCSFCARDAREGVVEPVALPGNGFHCDDLVCWTELHESLGALQETFQNFLFCLLVLLALPEADIFNEGMNLLGCEHGLISLCFALW